MPEPHLFVPEPTGDGIQVTITMTQNHPAANGIGCDKCHTTIPSQDYPQKCELPNGETAYLCSCCKVGYNAERV